MTAPHSGICAIRPYNCELALDADNRMIGLRCDVLDDYSAYFQYGVGHHGNALSQIVGPYRIRSVDLNVTAVLTNKCQQGVTRTASFSPRTMPTT